ncbi:hypothetical protein [Pedobacter cryophilus]|uniref:Uncharacterized protein n=1 Tax=Pedobacter cryophilus TaxID=2571271 RepID=A0A4U1BWZ7_9SPHI|nr:hypothetical protein [Pedobacter cryophilus]TKB96851.1 hypothetical protein FA046_12295 [Pedobacter cryophilus]
MKTDQIITSLDNASMFKTGPTAMDLVIQGPSTPAFNVPDLSDNNSVNIAASSPVSNAIAAYNPYDDDEEYISNYDLEDLEDEIFDSGLPKTNPNFFRKKTNTKPLFPIDQNGIVDGKYFGQPGTYFQKVDNYTGQVGMMYFNEIFPDELDEYNMSNLFGGKNKAKRVAKREQRQSDRRVRKQAKVDRKNKRVEIRGYKAETKRIGVENGEPSILDKVLDTAKGFIGGNDNNLTDEAGYDEGNYQTEGATDQNGNFLSVDKNFQPQTKTAGIFGSNPVVAILIMLALFGGVVYFIKTQK